MKHGWGFPADDDEKRHWRLRIDFKIKDFWIGIFWRRRKEECLFHVLRDGCPAVTYAFDLWICLFPCLPIHIQTWVTR